MIFNNHGATGSYATPFFADHDEEASPGPNVPDMSIATVLAVMAQRAA